MKAGEQQHYIVFEQQSIDPQDPGGGRPDVWNEIGRCFAALKPMGAYERLQALKQTMEVTHWVYVRNCGFTITSDMRFRILTADVTPLPALTVTDRVFGIMGIYDPEERGRQYRMMAREHTGTSY